MTAIKPQVRLKVQVWVYAQDEKNNRQILILKTRPERGGFWQPVTGGVEPGESIEAAALREATEETGLTFNSPPLSLEKSFTYEARDQLFQEYGFALEAKKIMPPVLDAHEHTDYRWVHAQEAASQVKFKSNLAMLETLLKKQGSHK